MISQTIHKKTSRLDFLFQPIDNSPLVLFRLIFGLLIALEAGGAIATGWVRDVFVTPAFTFNFIGFDWLQPLVGETMYAIYAAMAVAGILVMLGCYYRLAVGVYGLLWMVCYLLQKSSYNNHYYLLILFCGIMAVLPAHRYFSLDARQGRVAPSVSCPRWCLLVVVIQVAIVYFFAALAKVYPGWLAHEPLDIWFLAKKDYFLIGPLLQQDWLKSIVAYGGIAFDFLIVPLLLWKRSRLFAFVISVAFHLFNSAVFQIGIFPYMMIALCVFFFPPEKIRQIFFRQKMPLPEGLLPVPYRRAGVIAWVFYFAVQIYLPLRHYHYPGDVLWTEEGHRMSWRMMLKSKWGTIRFKVADPVSGDTWEVDPAPYLTPKQVSKLATHPDMIWQFSRFLEQDYARQGYADVAVYAMSQVSLNGSPLYPFIDEQVDLTAVDWQAFQHADWILPFGQMIK